MSQYNRSVRFDGRWDLARRKFNGLGFKVNKVTDLTMQEEAERAAARIRANIRNQVYARDGRHAPLAPSTVANKKNPENAEKILLDTEELVNAIGAFKNGYRTWVVGVQGSDELVEKAAANEWGVPERNLPARSTFRLEIERVRANGRLERLDSAFRKLLSFK